MPARQVRFDLPVAPDDSRRAALIVLEELGWAASIKDGGLEAAEDPARLCCTASPVKAVLSFHPVVAGTSVGIELSITGFGPAPKRQLADRAIGLEQRITRRAARSRAVA